MKNFALIDDTGFNHRIKNVLKELDVDMKSYYWLPNDASELEQFDGLIVDNRGIGNKDFDSGYEFLLAYAPTHKNQKLMFWSCDFFSEDERKPLEDLGVKILAKGRDPYDVFWTALKGETK